MFTGIITATAPIVSVSRNGSLTVRIKTPRGWKLAQGESVAVDGICSTVARLIPKWFEVAYIPTTLRKTTARYFATGTRVNLERSLRYGSRVNGHFVLGHVDARAQIVRTAHRGRTPIVTIALPSRLARFITARGSVAISGVSLTVAKKHRANFAVALIPYTTAHTTLGSLRRGGWVNIEVDVLARYGRYGTRGTVGRRHGKKL